MTDEWRRALAVRRQHLLAEVQAIDRAMAEDYDAQNKARRASWARCLTGRKYENPTPMVLPRGDRDEDETR